MSERDAIRDVEAEQSVLGALLIDRDAIATVSGIVTAQDFHVPAHRTIYAAILALWERKEPADLTTVSAELKARNQLESVGGIAALSDLMIAVPTSVHVEYYAGIVHKHAVRRRLMEAAGTIARIAHEADPASIERAIADALAVVGGIEVGIDHHDMQAYRDAVPQFLADLRDEWSGAIERDVAPSYFRQIDDAFDGGLLPGKVLWVGARPSIGKTAFGLQWLHNFARHEVNYPDKRWSIFFSAEMNLRALLYRSVSEVSSIDSSSLKTGTLTERQLHNLTGYEAFMRKLPIVVSDRSRITTDQMLQRVDRWSKKHGRVRLVVIDYSELLGDGIDIASLTEERRLTKISRGITHLAKETATSVIALTQLSRRVDERPGCRPQMSDIRWSGSIEQDADAIAFLFRQDYYEQKKMLKPEEIDDAKRNTAEVILAKNRDGRTGDFLLRFSPSITAFSNLEDTPR